MLKLTRLAAVGATVALMGLSTVGTASAMTNQNNVTHGYYSQSAGGLSCRGNVAGLPGGYLSVRIHGGETRPANQLMQSAQIRTRIIAQRQIDGVWRTEGYGGYSWGKLGSAHNIGHGMNFAPFTWMGGMPSQTSPRLHIQVHIDGTWRLLAATTDYDAGGLVLTHLTNLSNGTCTLTH